MAWWQAGRQGTAWSPDLCILRVTLLPGGILHITSVSQADVGTYRCVARNVANTRHSQDVRLTLSGKQGPGQPAGTGQCGGGGSWRRWAGVRPMRWSVARDFVEQTCGGPVLGGGGQQEADPVGWAHHWLPGAPILVEMRGCGNPGQGL